MHSDIYRVDEVIARTFNMVRFSSHFHAVVWTDGKALRQYRQSSLYHRRYRCGNPDLSCPGDSLGCRVHRVPEVLPSDIARVETA